MSQYYIQPYWGTFTEALRLIYVNGSEWTRRRQHHAHNRPQRQCGAENVNGIAQDLSIERPNSIVIGATDKIMQDLKGEVNVANGGDWLILKNGVEIDRYDGNWQPKSEPTKLDYLLYNKKDPLMTKIINCLNRKNENDWYIKNTNE